MFYSDWFYRKSKHITKKYSKYLKLAISSILAICPQHYIRVISPSLTSITKTPGGYAGFLLVNCTLRAYSWCSPTVRLQIEKHQCLFLQSAFFSFLSLVEQ